MFSRFTGLFGQKPQVDEGNKVPVVEENKKPDTIVYFDISQDITNLVISQTYDKVDKSNIFKDILKYIDTFIIDEEGSIKPIGKFTKFYEEEKKYFNGDEGDEYYVKYTEYYVIFSYNTKTDGYKETKITIGNSIQFNNVVLPKFYISDEDKKKYNNLKRFYEITGGKPKTRRNIRKRQKKYSRKNRIKSRRNRLMK